MWAKPIDKTLVSAVTTATNGTAATFLTDKCVDKVRYHVVSSGSTTATVDIQTSHDGTNWGAAITQISNPGTGTKTGTFDGPVKYIRAVTAGATHGTITVTVTGNVLA